MLSSLSSKDGVRREVEKVISQVRVQGSVM